MAAGKIKKVLEGSASERRSPPARPTFQALTKPDKTTILRHSPATLVHRNCKGITPTRDLVEGPAKARRNYDSIHTCQI